MKTKAQKKAEVGKGLENLKKSKAVVLVDFKGITTPKLFSFRRVTREAGATFQVIKKRLLRIIFQEKGIEFDLKELEGQVGVVFSSRDLAETAGSIYRFSKGLKEMIKMVGGIELKERKFFDAATITKIGQLPPREVLLGQLLQVLAAPIRQLMYVLSEKAKKVAQ